MDIKNIKLVLLLAVLYVSLPSLSWTEEACRSVFSEISEKLSGVDINQYKGKEGYVRFVEELEGTKSMDYVFHEVSKVLGRAKMKGLQWQKFRGTSEDFKNLKELLSLDVIEKYKGMLGYASFVEKYFEADMQKAYLNVSAVLGGASRLMKQLDWQQYQGSVSDFNKLREKILNEDGSIREEYKGSDGYAHFAKKYFEGNMQKAYQNVSAVLGGVREMRRLKLGWKIFEGTTDQFKDLKDLFKNNKREELKGEKGQSRVAREIFKGNKKRAYNMVSALREELLGSVEAFDELNWIK